MNRFWSGVAVLAMSLSLCGCAGCTYVRPGYVGVQSTSIGTGRGMKDVAVGPAWVTYNMITGTVFEYPTFMQTVVWSRSTSEGKPVNEEITFTNKDRMQIAADISLAYTLRPDHAAEFYQLFRHEDMHEFSDGIMRNWAREKFDDVGGRYDVNQIMGDNAQFLAEVRQKLQAELTPIGIELRQFGFIGAPRPPASVTESINLNVQATQIAIQKQNEVMQAEADAKKRVAEANGDAQAILARAEAQAQANRKLAESITPTLIEYRKLEKWDGHLPQVQSGTGGIMLSLAGK